MNVCQLSNVGKVLSGAVVCLLLFSCSASETGPAVSSSTSTVPAEQVSTLPTSEVVSSTSTVPAPVSVPVSTVQGSVPQSSQEVPFEGTVDSSTVDVAVVVSGVGMSIVRRNGDVVAVDVPEASLRLTTPSFSEYRLLTDLDTGEKYPMILVDDAGQIGQAATRYLLTRSKLYETGVVDPGPSGSVEGAPGGRNGSADPAVEETVIAALEELPGVVAVERVAPGVLRVEVG